MSSFLIRSLMSHCPDVDQTLEELCWSGSSMPDPERIEALGLFLREMSSRSQERSCQVEPVLWNQCVPLLKMLSSDGVVHHARRKEMLQAACDLLGVCVRQCEADVLEKIADIALPALDLSEKSEKILDVDVALEVLSVLLSCCSSNPGLLMRSISCTLTSLKELPDPLVSKVIIRVWFPTFKTSGEATRGDLLQHIWTDLLGWYEQQDTDAGTPRVLVCLTALSDHLFAPGDGQEAWNGPDPCADQAFFRMLQAGLVDPDGLSRKRALYLLKRCVSLAEGRNAHVDGTLFRWRPGSSARYRRFWEDYALVLETLEEYQIHVVRPVLSRIDTLVQAAATTTSQGGELLHPTWLLCIYRRMFHSENKAVVKEGVGHFLDLRQASFASAFSPVVVGPLMDVLAETSLYHRSAGEALEKCPEIGTKLQDFLATFFSSLPEDERGSTLLRLLRRLGSRHWYAVPLLFVCRAVSHLPPRPLLGADGLHALRELLRSAMITHQVPLRRATQRFLLHAALRLTDVTGVSLDDVFVFLSHFRADKSLRRGTRLWREVCDWLLVNERLFGAAEASEGAPPRDVWAHSSRRLTDYLSVPASSDETVTLPSADEAEPLACALLLCADLPEGAERGGLDRLLSPLLDVLRRLDSGVYLPLRKSDRSTRLTLQLLRLIQGNEDEVAGRVRALVAGVAEPVQEFVLRRLSGELQQPEDVDRAGLYLSLLRALVRTCSAAPGYVSNLEKNYVPRLVANCLRTLTETPGQNPSMAGQVQKAASMAALASLCQLAEDRLLDPESVAVTSLRSLAAALFCSSSSPQRFNRTLVKPHAPAAAVPGGRTDDGPALKDWGRVVAGFIRDQWACLCFLQDVLDPPSSAAAFRAAVQALALLPSDLVLPVLDFMRSALPQMLPHEEAACAEAISVSWRLVRALGVNAHDFWPTLRSFVRLAFQRRVLELKEDGRSGGVASCVRQVKDELLELSRSKSGVFNVLIRHCCSTWYPPDPAGRTGEAFRSALRHADLLTEACVYGPVSRRDQRVLQEVETYVRNLETECEAEATLPSESRDDQFPRVCVVTFLNRLEPSDDLHRALMEELVRRLLRKDEDVSRSKVRYYSNSLQHRVKNRAWQTVLLLLPKLRPEFVAEGVVGPACEAGFRCNQASVKYLMEWALILILHRDPSQIERLWGCFDADQEKTRTSVCTFLSVLVHLEVFLPRLEDKARQWRRAVEVILLWCFSHNFSVRLYALLALKRVWALRDAPVLAGCREGVAASPDGLAAVVEACLDQAEAAQNTGNANKNWSRIQEHFFFSRFHPVHDHSLETIFHAFPRLSELADDECVPAWKFGTSADPGPGGSAPVRNPGGGLRELRPGDWIQQDRGDPGAESEAEARRADVQKKIAPWSLSVREQEPQLTAQQRAARLGKPGGGLLVVASLIDKPANLGGLCRTCEIFGASALVLGGSHHISDRQFQALSVSSELWLPLLEVKPNDLPAFLQQKKNEGYSIIGVEQTANSQSLESYRFPQKSLLLLGNEREGIPADMLQWLDVCVEIPQRGVTRSLNVHVSAALLVWEYTRQHSAPNEALH
ncbi:probable methyltransferase TARBP1 [Trichomycterus rosablanca]|uniref:probable methyltransferase TARBP1 n=1 Tax=Trichomycterus rosablanca TaxID=2290929 RepID=UPI002F35FFDE